MRPLLLLAIVLSTRLAQAQAERLPLVLDEAQLLARLSSDPRLELVAAEVEEARAEVLAAAARPNPSVAYDREALGSGAEQATDLLRFSLPLELSGRRAARTAAARAEVAAVAAEGAAARFAVTAQALRSFRLAQYEQARSELYAAERVALASAVEVVSKRHAAGSTSGYDLQRIELELASYDDAIAEAAAAREAAQRELGLWIGAPEGVQAAGALPAAVEPGPVAALLAAALDERPELRAAGARAQAAESLARAARRGWIPELVLSAGVMKQERPAGDPAWGATAGLALSLPLFEHGQADRLRAHSLARRAAAARQLATRAIPSAIGARHAALVHAVARARSVEQAQLARLPQLVRSAEAAYRDGAGTIVELVDAYATARDVRLRALELRRDVQLAQLDLWLALGRRI